MYPDAGVTQLFDVQRDPWETNDVSGRPESAAVRTRLLERLRRFQRELGDDFAKVV